MRLILLLIITFLIFVFVVDVSSDINRIANKYTGERRDTFWDHISKSSSNVEQGLEGKADTYNDGKGITGNGEEDE